MGLGPWVELAAGLATRADEVGAWGWRMLAQALRRGQREEQGRVVPSRSKQGKQRSAQARRRNSGEVEAAETARDLAGRGTAGTG